MDLISFLVSSLPNRVADVDVEQLGVVAVDGGDGGGATVPPRVDLGGGGLAAVQPVLDLGPDEDKLPINTLKYHRIHKVTSQGVTTTRIDANHLICRELLNRCDLNPWPVRFFQIL